MRLAPTGAIGWVLMVAASWPLVACGGRDAHPVDATTTLDDQLDCEHLRAERQINDARIADLRGEKGDATDNNVRGVVASVGVGLVMLDVSGAQGKEISAYQERNKVLDGLITKKCQANAGAAGN